MFLCPRFETIRPSKFGSSHDYACTNADIELGHHSATACHLGNVASRLKRTLFFDGKNEQIVGDEEANTLLTRKYRKDHWAAPSEA